MKGLYGFRGSGSPLPGTGGPGHPAGQPHTGQREAAEGPATGGHTAWAPRPVTVLPRPCSLLQRGKLTASHAVRRVGEERA